MINFLIVVYFCLVMNDVSAFAGVASSNLKNLSVTIRPCLDPDQRVPRGHSTLPEQDICLHHADV
jgi:hypothetical protein